MKLIYLIDGETVSQANFRANPQRVEAENHLVGAYQNFIGHLRCEIHDEPPGYELKFFTETGECKISTLACCPEFDVKLNNALLQAISESDPDNEATQPQEQPE